MLELYREGLSDMPQTQDCWVSPSQFKPANVSAINARALGKRGLG